MAVIDTSPGLKPVSDLRREKWDRNAMQPSRARGTTLGSAGREAGRSGSEGASRAARARRIDGGRAEARDRRKEMWRPAAGPITLGSSPGKKGRSRCPGERGPA